MVGDGAATLVARVFEASGLEPPADALERFLALYDRAAAGPHPPVSGHGGRPRSARPARDARRADEQAARRRRAGFSPGSISRGISPDDAVVGGDGPFPRKPDPAGLRHLMRAREASRSNRRCSSAIPSSTGARRAPRRRRCVSRGMDSGTRGFRAHELGSSGSSDRCARGASCVVMNLYAHAGGCCRASMQRWLNSLPNCVENHGIRIAEISHVPRPIEPIASA